MYGGSSVSAGRRALLGAGAGAAAAAFFGGSGRAFAEIEALERAIAEFGGEAGMAGGRGPLSLTLPRIAENGNSVALSFSVESPMTAEDHIESVVILAPENPYVRIATFHFTPMSGTAKAATRMRLARTQDVIALARTGDGRRYRAQERVEVTIGGCGG